MTPGKETSEWKVWVTTLAAALAAGLGAVVSSGALEEGSTLYVVLGTLGTILAAIGGVSWKYIASRTEVKKAQALADAAKLEDPS
jgi:Zn-dependent alcohol dehydrogenase